MPVGSTNIYAATCYDSGPDQGVGDTVVNKTLDESFNNSRVTGLSESSIRKGSAEGISELRIEYKKKKKTFLKRLFQVKGRGNKSLLAENIKTYFSNRSGVWS